MAGAASTLVMPRLVLRTFGVGGRSKLCFKAVFTPLPLLHMVTWYSIDPPDSLPRLCRDISRELAWDVWQRAKLAAWICLERVSHLGES